MQILVLIPWSDMMFPALLDFFIIMCEEPCYININGFS